MKQTKRVSFDVPLEDHTFLRIECAKAHIPFRDLMKEVFHKTVKAIKKKKLHGVLEEGFQESYEGKTNRLTQKDLDKWNEMLSDE